MKKLTGFVVALILAIGGTAWAQGTQTGTLSGTVTDQDGLVLPGVTVTVTSPALQGARSTVTDGNGVYTLPGLPSGDYSVRFELTGLRTVEARQQVSVGQPARVNATMQLATVSEVVEVTAEVPTLIQTVQGGANYEYQEIDKLASPRTIQGIAELAPGLSDNTPNLGQVTISGAFAYDNQFMVDGVDVADNLFGNANNLFIEDALEEVQVLTSGISAEFGRFSGGVINAVTKSGSNTFSGSYRANPYKPSWTKRTPFEVESNTQRTGDVQWVHEATLGGPILRDRVWFFSAFRRQATETPAPLQDTGIANATSVENNRFEVKGTSTVAANHTFQGSYIRNHTNERRTSFAFSVDPSTVVERELPNDLWIASYRGVLGSRLFATAQVSRREFGFRNTGGTSTAIVDSPYITRGFTTGVTATRHFNAPYFDSTDPEDRNNRQFAGSLSYFVTTRGTGSHDLKVGYENFTTSRVGGNSQSATGFVFATDYLVENGAIVLDSNQRPIPIFRAGPGLSRLENWLPTRGAQIDIETQSFYAHDRWAYNSNLTLDLGVRFEMNDSEASGDIVGVDTSRVVPRLGATYDLTGEGKYTVQATYAHYAGKYSETQIADNTDVGTPSLLLYEYRGPNGQGRDFAPGLDISNYALIGGNFPTANVFFDENLKSPLTKEFTVSAGTAVGRRGAVKLTFQQRNVSDFIEDFIDDPNPATGHIPVVRNGVNFGTFNRVLYANSEGTEREYRALITQGNYRLRDRWTANAHWTLQLRNHGNFEGELANQPGISSTFGDYPEMLGERNNPFGRINDFQRHKVRAWTTYGLDLRGFGSVDSSLLWRFNSPQTFSFQAAGVPITPQQAARNPGYARPPTAQTLFFGERGVGEYEGSHQFDVAFTYQVPVFRTLRPWLKFEVYNMLNDQSLVTFNTAVTANNAGARDENGLPTEFTRGSNFGRATAITHFPRATNSPGGTALYARTWLMSFGVRF
jgi:hypothetical protein